MKRDHDLDDEHGTKVEVNTCFPSLPLMLVCGVESRLGLECSDFSMRRFL